MCFQELQLRQKYQNDQKDQVNTSQTMGIMNEISDFDIVKGNNVYEDVDDQFSL